MNNRRYLLLRDGRIYEGRGFGAAAAKVSGVLPGHSDSSGEVVFNTGMSGYPEIITDPSYTGQLVVMTYPLIGNYGMMQEWSEYGAEQKLSAGGVSGLIIKSLYKGPVPEGRISLDSFMKQSGIPGITGIDTRELTLSLRDRGSLNGILLEPEDHEEGLTGDEVSTASEYLKSMPPMEGLNLAEKTGQKGRLELNKRGYPHFAVIDCGIKNSIVKELITRGCRVTVMSVDSRSEEIMSVEPDGVLVSNGPGDPAALTDLIDVIRRLLGKTVLTGICLGHQLISLALGARTYKMKFGHHGINHPVRETFSGKVFITSQNHGFAVDRESMSSGMEVWLENSNDRSVEGMKHKNLPVLTAQFHPEAAPGPHDSVWIFDSFIELVQTGKIREAGNA